MSSNDFWGFFLMCAISGAFHPLWLSVSQLQWYSLNTVTLPWAITQHGQEVGALPLIFSEIGKTAMWFGKPYQEDGWAVLWRRRLRDIADDMREGGLPETETMSCHLHSAVCEEEIFQRGRNSIISEEMMFVIWDLFLVVKSHFRFPSYCTATKM